MRPIFTFTFALFLLIACSSNAPAPTLTTISSTSTPNSQPATPNSPTPTIPPTETLPPTRTIDLQPLPPAWTAALGDQFEIAQNGEIINTQSGDAIPEMRLNPDGTMTRTYEYEGKNFILPLDPAKDIKVLPNGNLDMQGWIWNSETGEMERKYFSVKDGINTAEKGETLYSIAEIQAFLANPDNVDLSKEARREDEDFKNYLHYCTVSSPECSGLDKNYGSNMGGEVLNKNLWGDNKIPIPDGKGGYATVDTATFIVTELKNKPITIVAFTGKDGQVKIMLGDTNVMLTSNDNEIKDWRSTSWGKYYENHDSINFWK